MLGLWGRKKVVVVVQDVTDGKIIGGSSCPIEQERLSHISKEGIRKMNTFADECETAIMDIKLKRRIKAARS